MKEADLFEPIKNLLLDSDMEVYTEVPCSRGRADIVAVRNKLVTTVEMKTSLSLQVIEQAHNHIYEAHYTYIAIPMPKRGYRSHYVQRILEMDGIGLMHVNINHDDKRFNFASVVLPAKLHRKLKHPISIKHLELYRYENNIAGGTAGGGYNTPYKDMMNSVKRFLRRQKEPVSMAEIIEHVEVVSRHYMNPKSSLFKALRVYEKDWCEMVKIDGATCFKYKEPTDQAQLN